MSIGDKIINEIILQGMVKTDPLEPTVLVWSSNAEEQLSAVVESELAAAKAELARLQGTIDRLTKFANERYVAIQNVRTGRDLACAEAARLLVHNERLIEERRIAFNQVDSALLKVEELKAEAVRLREALEYIVKQPTDQAASPTQCSMVAVAMEALAAVKEEAK
jgi:hypothetical protein